MCVQRLRLSNGDDCPCPTAQLLSGRSKTKIHFFKLVLISINTGVVV